MSGRVSTSSSAVKHWIPSDAHSIKLDTYFQRVKLGDAQPAPGGRHVARLYTRHESSAAYLLTRAGARRYLELTANPALPADYSLFPRNPRKLGLHVYQLTPAIAIQDHLLRPEHGGQKFVTAMAGGDGADARRSSARDRLGREVERLMEQGQGLRRRSISRPS